MKKVFLILSTNNIGGAEKRFAGLWQSMNESGKDVHTVLVASKKLIALLQKHEGLSLQFRNGNYIEHDMSGDFKNFQRSAKSFVKDHAENGDIIHFIGDHPLCSFNHQKIVYSITQSSLKNLNTSGKLGQLGGALFSNAVDVLDPNIFQFLRRLFFYQRNKFYRTSNSYCDVDLFSGLPFQEKKDWFVFLGRFEAMKQVTRLLDALPAIHQSLKGIATREMHFYIMGHGSLQKELEQFLKEERFNGLPITVGYTDQPEQILKESRFFFSLQLHNNYPSRSLIEAMAAGNIPIVTDVGQTRWLAKPEFSYYVPEHFSQQDLVKTIAEIYCEGEKTLSEKSGMARQFVMHEHTIEKMREYYLGIYQKI